MRSEHYSTWCVCVCVCVCVCLSVAILVLKATGRPMNDTSGFRATRAWKRKGYPPCSGDMMWKPANSQYANWTINDLPQPSLACSAHCGGMKLLEGQVSSPALFETLLSGAASPCLERELTLSTISWRVWPWCACILYSCMWVMQNLACVLSTHASTHSL